VIEQWEPIILSRHATLMPGTDQARFRLIGAEEWSMWHHIPAEDGPVSVDDFVLSRPKSTEWEFRRPVTEGDEQ